MKMLLLDGANRIANERRQVSDGGWYTHSLYVAKAARAIASQLDMDADKAYAMGLMHDIGRSFTTGQFRHITAGYEYMSKCDYGDIARICLTHSFPIQDIFTYVGDMDIDEDEQRKYQIILKSEEYTIYDRLIQLCDNISTANGYVIPERKFVVNAFKYGLKDTTLKRWQTVLDIYDDFERMLGINVILFLERIC